jgi:branched-chain amino acid transport system ATP-binding protein
MSILAVEDVTIERSGLPIVQGASLSVAERGITVLLGANGAGKTTLLEGISGVLPLAKGAVSLNGERVEKLRAWRRARLGLEHVEQSRTVFRELTAQENLEAAVRGGATVDEAFELFPELKPHRGTLAGLLSGGQQQMLVLARALVTRPKVLLIDEMSLGLAPIIVDRLLAAVRELASSGVGVLLVEQFAPLALSIGDRAYVLRRGRTVFDGPCSDLTGDEDRLRAMYLGEASPQPTGGPSPASAP